MRKLDIFGSTYEIHENCDLDCDGDCNSITKVIRLARTVRDRETLVHEIAHAIMFEGGVYQGVDQSMQEVIAQQMAVVIVKNFTLRFK